MHEDDGLHEGLAEDDFDGSYSFRERGTPAPFSVLQYPQVQLAECSQSRTEVVVNLFINLLGVGVLATPSALASSGLLAGLVILGGMAAASRQALLLLLGTGMGIPCERPYPELGRLAFGPQGFATVLVLHLVYAGGMLAACLASLAEMLGQVVSTLLGVVTLPRGMLVAVAVMLCIPGALTRSLVFTPTMAVTCVVAAALFVFALPLYCIADLLPSWFPGAPIDPGGIAEDVAFGGLGLGGFFAAARIFAFQFSVHAGALELFGAAAFGAGSADDGQEMGSPGRRSGRGLQHNEESSQAAEEVSFRAFVGSAPVVAAIAMVGYLRFGAAVSGDLLVSLTTDRNGSGINDSILDKVFALVKLAYCGVLIASVAFITVPGRNAALELFLVRRSAAPSSRTFRRATLAFLAACACVAWFVTDLSGLLSVVGAWGAAPLVFVMPAACSMELARQHHGRPYVSPSNLTALLLFFMGGLLMFSSVCSFLSLALTYPAGHRGHRIVTMNLNNITTNPMLGR